MSAVPAPYRVCLVVGTRPEAIKMAPLVTALRRREALAPILVATTQHREMLAQALDAFGIVPDVDLGLMQHGQDLGAFTARALAALTACIGELRPHLLLVQGDTSSVTAAALAAFYQGVPVGHVEAGLRSFDLASPFPEEANRRIATSTASLHFAPTPGARANLLREGIPGDDIYVTGNTVVDALHAMPRLASFETRALDAVRWDDHRVLLVTVHRRESQGDRLDAICDALHAIVARHHDVEIVFPVHRNPRVRDTVLRRLGAVPRLHLLDPLPYHDLLEVMRRMHFALSDSGGIQEEVPSFRKPILILRDCTERPEVIDAGFGELVGTETLRIVARTSALLADDVLYAQRTAGENPFGDGAAASRIAAIVEQRLRQGFAIAEVAQDRRDSMHAALERLAIAG